MPSITDDFNMPIMYEDLRKPSLGMLPGFGMYTNYLGGVTLPRELPNDSFVYQNRALKEKSAIKKAAIIIGSLAGAVILKQKGAFKWIGKQCTDAGNIVKGWFARPKPPAAP